MPPERATAAPLAAPEKANPVRRTRSCCQAATITSLALALGVALALTLPLALALLAADTAELATSGRPLVQFELLGSALHLHGGDDDLQGLHPGPDPDPDPNPGTTPADLTLVLSVRALLRTRLHALQWPGGHSHCHLYADAPNHNRNASPNGREYLATAWLPAPLLLRPRGGMYAALSLNPTQQQQQQQLFSFNVSLSHVSPALLRLLGWRLGLGEGWDGDGAGVGDDDAASPNPNSSSNPNPSNLKLGSPLSPRLHVECHSNASLLLFGVRALALPLYRLPLSPLLAPLAPLFALPTDDGLVSMGEGSLGASLWGASGAQQQHRRLYFNKVLLDLAQAGYRGFTKTSLGYRPCYSVGCFNHTLDLSSLGIAGTTSSTFAALIAQGGILLSPLTYTLSPDSGMVQTLNITGRAVADTSGLTAIGPFNVSVPGLRFSLYREQASADGNGFSIVTTPLRLSNVFPAVLDAAFTVTLSCIPHARQPGQCVLLDPLGPVVDSLARTGYANLAAAMMGRQNNFLSRLINGLRLSAATGAASSNASTLTLAVNNVTFLQLSLLRGLGSWAGSLRVAVGKRVWVDASVATTFAPIAAGAAALPLIRQLAAAGGGEGGEADGPSPGPSASTDPPNPNPSPSPNLDPDPNPSSLTVRDAAWLEEALVIASGEGGGLELGLGPGTSGDGSEIIAAPPSLPRHPWPNPNPNPITSNPESYPTSSSAAAYTGPNFQSNPYPNPNPNLAVYTGPQSWREEEALLGERRALQYLEPTSCALSPAPTPVPTPRPSALPSALPSYALAAPTPRPSPEPSLVPTRVPTPIPTPRPTSPIPTPEPSPEPSLSPTKAPSYRPSYKVIL